ncbi:MAG TPA: Crp/Fnr family transcriptional regulator [Stellaceae bacterium]|nr:Crp/Fnr family transcriptional regulator [Stellaceae bacterium]
MAERTPEWMPSAILRGSTVRELRAREALFRQGDPASAIFVLERGRLRLVRHTVDHRKVVIHTARAGDLFAEAALFATSYHCDAVADIASRVRVFSKRRVLAAVRSDPPFAEQLMAVLAREVQALRSRLEQRNIRSARERILHHLALAAGSDGRTVRLSGSLMDLAAEIGLSHEALYRTLAALQREGAIARTPEGLVLRKKRGL